MLNRNFSYDYYGILIGIVKPRGNYRGFYIDCYHDRLSDYLAYAIIINGFHVLDSRYQNPLKAAEQFIDEHFEEDFLQELLEGWFY